VENHEKPTIGWPDNRLRFEPGISQTQVWSMTTTQTFSVQFADGFV